jgi:hypothetical protein
LQEKIRGNFAKKQEPVLRKGQGGVNVALLHCHPDKKTAVPMKDTAAFCLYQGEKRFSGSPVEI